MAREAIIIGGGAREHALVHSLSEAGIAVWAAPGNAGMADEAILVPAKSPQEVAAFFADRRPLVIIGPEAPLADGWADFLREAGFPVVGPSRVLARLESSKRMAKEVMQTWGIPTAHARTALSTSQLAQWAESENRWPKVLKQSGLAQGKGVLIAHSREEALAAIAEWGRHPYLFKDGILYEDYLEGYELSVQVLTNGDGYQWLPVARDYKRLTPDDHSPNTGGMGAIAPVSLAPDLVNQINAQVLDPLMEYLSDSGSLYRGVLYVGIMVTAYGPLVLEFNVRLGDPETQVIIPALDLDWYEVWMGLSQGELPPIPAARHSAVGIVMAAAGYPASPQSGMPIQLGEPLADTTVYHAGTVRTASGWESRGGRVLTVVGRAASTARARQLAYQRAQGVTFPNSYYRPDIGEPLEIDLI